MKGKRCVRYVTQVRDSLKPRSCLSFKLDRVLRACFGLEVGRHAKSFTVMGHSVGGGQFKEEECRLSNLGSAPKDIKQSPQ